MRNVRRNVLRACAVGLAVTTASALHVTSSPNHLQRAEALTQWYQILSIGKDAANGKDLCLTVIGDYPKFTDCVSGSTTQQWMFGNYSNGQYIYNRYAKKVVTYNGAGGLLSLTTYTGAAKQLTVQGDPTDAYKHIRPRSATSQCWEPTAWKKANVYITTGPCDSYDNGIQGFWTRLAATT